MPVASGYFKNCKGTVVAPIDLVPPETQEIHLETVWEGRLYVLTFRKTSGVGLTVTTQELMVSLQVA